MRPNRLCCVLSTAALALCVAVSSAETTEAREVSSHSTAADSATLCVEFVEHALVSVLNYGDDTPSLPALPAPQPPKKIADKPKFTEPVSSRLLQYYDSITTDASALPQVIPSSGTYKNHESSRRRTYWKGWKGSLQ